MEDFDAIDEAYGYAVGDIIRYKELVQGKIVGFDHNYIVYVNFYDPDEKTYPGPAQKVSINDCE